jgi:hypothetical protein
MQAPFSGQAPRFEEVPVPRSLGIIELGEIRREIRDSIA